MAGNTQLIGSDSPETPSQTGFMEEDRQALDSLWEGILADFPPGEKRDFWLARVYKIAAVTRCPQGIPKKPRFRLVRSAVGFVHLAL
jgi:hypothetical protein